MRVNGRKMVIGRPDTCPHVPPKAVETRTHAFGFRGCIGARANLDFTQFWPANPSLRDLPPYKILCPRSM